MNPYPQIRRSLTDVIYVVAEHFGVSPSDVLSPSRARLVAMARRVAYALCRDLTKCSAPEIGRVFVRDHSTVLAEVKRLADEMKQDNMLAHSVALCRARALETIRARRLA